MITFGGGKRRRQVEHEAFLAALQSVVEIAREQSRAVEALAAALKAQLEAFQTPGEARRWAHNDLTELLQDEAQRREEVERLQALATSMDFDPLRL